MSGLPIYHHHTCHLGGLNMNRYGTRGLGCNDSQGRHSRHREVNDIIWWSLTAVLVASHLEPPGLTRSIGKCPDGASIIA